MLEQMRRQGASIFVYLIFGLLIVIFVYGINPGNRGGEGGCRTMSNTVIAVDGKEANNTSFLIAHESNGAKGRQKVYVALDQIIRRELLAQAAEEHGIRGSDELIDEEIKQGYFFLGGQRIDFKRQFMDPTGEFFKFKQFKAWVDSLRVSPGSYREEQARGLQAALMADLLTSSVRVSHEEALADYIYDNDTVTYDVVAFEPAKYARALKITDADVKRFLDGHNAEVEARYKADERTYKGVKPQLALREIFIPKAAPEAARPAEDKAAVPSDDKADKAAKPGGDKAAKPGDDKAKPANDKAAKPGDKKADKVADKKPGTGDAPKQLGLPIEVAKARLEGVRAAITAGRLTFADAEKQLATDSAEDAPQYNGDHGWRSADSPGLGDKEVDDAAKVLKAGEMTPVIATDRGVYLVVATEKREGDLSYDQVKTEIAKTLAKDQWGKEAAKRDALDTLAKAQAGKALDQIFERELVRPSGGFEQLQEILNNPDIPQETKQQLLQQYMQSQQPPKHGSLERRENMRGMELHEKDVPVAWTAEPDGSANGGGSAAGSATPANAPASGAATAPAAGGASAKPPGSGSAGSASAGAAAPAASPPVPPVAAPIAASNDVLPQLGTVAKAKVNRVGPFPRQSAMQGIGRSKEAIEALFSELAPGSLGKSVYEGENGAYVVIQLINRSQPKVDEFEKMANTEIARMRDARGRAALHGWLKARCDALTKAGKIRPAPDKIRETDDKGNPAPTVYRPCMYFDVLDR